MSTIAQRCKSVLQELSATVRVLRAPLLLAVLAFFILSSPAQVLELYLLLARDHLRLWPQVALAAVSLAALSFVIASVSDALTRADNTVNATRTTQSAPGAVTRSAPVLLGILPLLGAMLGLYRAWRSVLTEYLVGTVDTISGLQSNTAVTEAVKKLAELKITVEGLSANALSHLNELTRSIVPQSILELPARTEKLSFGIYSAIGFCIVVAVLVLVFFGRSRTSSGASERPAIFHWGAWTIVLALLAALTSLFALQSLNAGRQASFDFTSLPRSLGTLALVNLCLMFLVYFCSLLTRAADRNGIPVIAPLIALAILVSMQNWSDNHSIRQLTLSAAEVSQRKSAKDWRVPPLITGAFEDWLAARPPEYVKKFEGKPYPIYIVAAQGGGMYAANLSGLALARLYDRCPAIRHHIFAISGVSGGSVGAGYFSALLNTPGFTTADDTCSLQPPANGKGPLEAKMSELLTSDFLSPVAASFLFPDLLQRFIPAPVEAFDRARAFEAGLETAWDSIVKSEHNPLRDPFSRHWRPDGASPMLLLNATVVETGRQLAISPTELAPGKGYNTFGIESLHEIFDLKPSVDLPLSTAMSLSARFPVVMPAGQLKLEKLTARIVDGGYFDNSGVETAIAVMTRVRDQFCKKTPDFSNCVREKSADNPERKLSFKAIVLTDFDPQANPFRDQRRGGEGLNEILSPVRTMFNVRVARGDYTSGRLHDFVAPRQDNVTIVDQPPAGPNDVPVMRITLNQHLYVLPLGWQISAQVQDIVSAQIGEPANCGFGRHAPAFEEATGILDRVGIGLRAVADEKAKLKVRKDLPGLYSTMYGLKDNQCAVFDVLSSDGLVPRRVQCQDAAIEETFEFTVPSTVHVAELKDDSFKQLVAPYEEELSRKWGAKVEAALGKTWANSKVAIVTGGGCEVKQEGLSSCALKARPCDNAYYSFFSK